MVDRRITRAVQRLEKYLEDEGKIYLIPTPPDEDDFPRQSFTLARDGKPYLEIFERRFYGLIVGEIGLYVINGVPLAVLRREVWDVDKKDNTYVFYIISHPERVKELASLIVEAIRLGYREGEEYIRMFVDPRALKAMLRVISKTRIPGVSNEAKKLLKKIEATGP